MPDPSRRGAALEILRPRTERSRAARPTETPVHLRLPIAPRTKWQVKPDREHRVINLCYPPISTCNPPERCNSDKHNTPLLQHSNTPTAHVAGIENSLSAVAQAPCRHPPNVGLASEARSTTRASAKAEGRRERGSDEQDRSTDQRISG